MAQQLQANTVQTKQVGVLRNDEEPFAFYCINSDNSIQIFDSKTFKLITNVFPPPTAKEII